MSYRVQITTLCLAGALAIGAHGAATADEIPPAEALPCFPGAYYRKAVSSVDFWTGIEGVIVLPAIEFDEDRRRPNNPNHFLDNASIYMGGRAGEQEIDAGLTWEVIRQSDGTISPERVAWRPFWRNNVWANAPAVPEYYYFPGDTIRMKCAISGENELVLEIQVLERAEGSPSQELSTFTVAFEAPGFGPESRQEFKRVNAIDQFGNEGGPVSPTKTQIMGGEWIWVTLFRGEEKRPFTTDRFTDMRCPDVGYHRVTTTTNAEAGGERIDISGGTFETSTAWVLD